MGHGSRTAFHWVGNDEGETKDYTFSDMFNMVCQMANVLKDCGVKKGDPVAIYLPMVIQLPVAMLACARIGAIHSVIFGGFSSESLAGRILDSKCKVIVTADGVMRGPKMIKLIEIVREAFDMCKSDGHQLDHVLISQRLPEDQSPLGELKNLPHQYKLLKDLCDKASNTCPVEWMKSEDPLFMLYTSGSTGKPKGVLHTTAGYMIWSYTTFKYTFDYRPGDIFFCTADCGWITGHSYITYGPMLNGATQVLFEGIPTHPTNSRFWEICEQYKVTQFYTAPTAIRALMRFGDEPVQRCNLSSLKVLGSVGEPINSEAWKWYHTVVGSSKCPIVDTWWQTETGGHMITPLPGATPLKPGSATFPMFGVVPAVLDAEGREITETECEGYLAIKQPWPGQMRTVFGDHERFEKTYFELYDAENNLICNHFYITGDGCRRDKDGYYWLTGRVDDVINVSGHRIGTAEVESKLDEHVDCTEAAVVGYPHPVKGEGIYAYVILKEGVEPCDRIRQELKNKVRKEIGAFAQPDIIHWAPGLPKTRSGKIMRRILRKIAAGQTMVDDLGDVSTLADPSVVESLIASKADAA
mmetsp:Transcript_1126/g.3529  ORF Transcript_1126/g.3529 Transcript_1126/m.3529 type:complete len:583 (-) Transcript_1126:201-1949(-)